MSTFAFLLLCVQSCLVQNVYSQYYRGAEFIAPAYGLGAPYGLEIAAPLPCGCGPAYGGSGVGDVAVAGELPVCGTTLVAGQVPILGAVDFGGIVPAAGEVSIAGRCGCGCGGGYAY